MTMTFEEIMAPLGAETFRREYLGKKPLHLKGNPEKFARVMNWDVLNRLLAVEGAWNSDTLRLVLDKQRIAPADYTTRGIGREGHPALLADMRKVQGFLKQGATLVANSIEGMTPELVTMSGELERALGGRAQANLYLSSKRKQGFKAHFDVHDVFAVHVMGEKVWHVFKGVEPDPINHPAFNTLSDEYMDKQKGEKLMEVRLEPGDLLYLPRGQYHYALAEDGGTAHIAFSLTYPIGIDIISYVHERFVADPLGRANLPADPAALPAHLEKLAARLAEIATEPALAERLVASRRMSGQGRVLFDLPDLLESDNTTFEVRAAGLRLVEAGGRCGLAKEGTRQAVEVPMAVKEQVAWVLKQQRFDRATLARTFPSMPAQSLDKFLADMQHMAVLQPVA